MAQQASDEDMTDIDHIHTPGLVVQDLPPEIDSSVADSAIGDVDREFSTTSIRESVYNFECVHGRTYHSYHKGKYLVPNDESEMDRLDLQHFIWILTLEGRLHLAPLPNSPLRVLDVGTGTGIWAVEFAQTYPSAEVIGTDLSPIQPAFVPPNCSFIIDDAEDEWIDTYQFNYIHARTIMNCFTSMRSIFSKAFAALAPGGYLEIQDGCLPLRSADNTLNDTSLSQWSELTLAGSELLGRKWADPRTYQAIMQDVGFVDVMEYSFKWPLNTWPKDPKLKELGLWVKEDMQDILSAVKKVFTCGLKWENDDFEDLMDKAKRELKNRRIHAWIDIVVVYGRKPNIP